MTDPLEPIAQRMADHLQADIDAAFRDAYAKGLGFFNPMGGSFIANDHERPPLTAASIRESMQRLEREFGPRLPPPMKIQESEHAMRDDGPARPYPKRKAKSVSHWRRMNKKWLKRYGMKRVPCMYTMDTSRMTGRPGITLLVHPTIAPKLYAAIASKYS